MMTSAGGLRSATAGRAAIAAVIGVLAWAGAPAARAESGVARTYLGPAVAIGKGDARTVVLADAGNRPLALGVELSAGALAGLPAEPNAKDTALDWHYYLQLPKGAPATGYDHVLIDWHPTGHPPPGIYTVPHFDFHFYLISQPNQMAIHYAHPETPDMADVKLPEKALLAPGYMIPPGTQVDQMGVHAVSAAAPELHGKPFTSTMIYGYDNSGALAFLDPMVATAYLATRPDEAAEIPLPSVFSFPGYYPGRYSVTYDAQKQTYRVLLEQLKPWEADKLTSARAAK